MRKRILLVIAACLLLSGCGNAGSSAEKANPEAELEISLYCMADNYNVDAYIREFHKTYKKVKVNKTAFDTIEQFDETIANELNAGKGPDVVLFSPPSSLDLMQMAKNGVFAPLDAYMEISDNPPKAENYISGTFEAGRIGGKQYILPVSITIPFLAYGLHRSYPFEAEPILRYDVFRDAVCEDMEQFRNDSETGIFEYSKSLESLLLSAQILRWDAEYKDISYDAGQLRDFVEFIADIQRDYDAKSADILSRKGDTPASWIAYFRYSYMNSPDFSYMVKSFNAMEYTLNRSSIGISILTNYDGSQVCAFAGVSGAVNKNAGEKAVYAYEFLRAAMDSAPLSGQVMGNYLSINKGKIKEQIETYKTAAASFSYGDMWIEDPGLGDGLAENLTAIVDGIDQVLIRNPQSVNIFMETFEAYWEGLETYESCFSDFQQRLRLYLTE